MMPAKGTKETWLVKVLDRHPENADKYDYSQVVYKNADTKVIIRCKKHDWNFEQVPYSHLAGAGCKKCSDEKEPYNKDTKETWLTRVLDRHPERADKYDYSLVEYKDSKTKVSIICSKHGVFQQPPQVHMNHGCNKCGFDSSTAKNSSNTTTWVAEILRKYPENAEKYDYSKVDYKNAYTKVKIGCLKDPEHGFFSQMPLNHWKGSGCQGCVPIGFFPHLPAHYYVNRVMQDGKFVWYKAGVSGNWQSRLKDIKRRYRYLDEKYTVEPVQQKYFESGAEAWDFEQEMLKKTDIRAPVLDVPGGHELFLQNPLEEE
jgi:hypothetical protein